MIRSELLNLKSTPTAWLLLIGSMLMAAASLLANLATFDTVELADEATIQQVMHASTVATVTFAAVAGLVTATSDYRHGRIDQLLLSEPRPSRVLGIKSIVGAALGLLYGLAGSVVAVLVLAVYYRLNDVAIDLLSSEVLRPLVGVVIASGLFVILGLGLGTAIRNQPAAIAGGLTMLLVIQPPLLLGLPDIGRWLPGAAALSMTLAPDSALLGQVAGTIVLVAWTMFALVVGDQRLKKIGA